MIKLNNILGIYQEGTNEEVRAFFIGSQILKFLGNLFLSTDLSEVFKSIKFYEKIFYLLSIFFKDNEMKMKNISKFNMNI